MQNKLNFRFLNNVFAWVAFAIATIVYLLTLERTASFWDCGEFIACSYKLQVPHPPGAPFFLLIGRMFSLLASDVTQVAFWINVSSALASGFTILFLFWTITLFGIKLFPHQNINQLTDRQTILLLVAGLVGSLAYAFTDSFWFSAVEAEVYALSSFFTALVVWAVLKWELVEDERTSNQWLILIAYIVGLSTGIHLLNLVTIPALALIYYYKNYEKPTIFGIFATMFVGLVLVLLIMEGVIAGLPTLAGNFEIVFVNNFGLPVSSGIIFFMALLIGGLGYGIFYTAKTQKVLANTALLSTAFILIGYATYGIVAIRANYNPPINENDPSDILKFVSYLKREQYGSRPLLYGPTFASDVARNENGEVIKNYKGAVYRFVKEKGKYEIYDKKEEYVYKDNMVLPRIYSRAENHKELYIEQLYGPERVEAIMEEMRSRDGNFQPTMSDNLKFMFTHQMGHMYWRYFVWNFVGRESDNDGAGGYPLLKKDLPSSITQNKAHNNYWGLPLLLGIIGFLYCTLRSQRTLLITGMLFLMTGLALVVYLNSPPVEPRERDYIYVGSFYAFAIWIGFAMIALPEIFVSFFEEKKSFQIGNILNNQKQGNKIIDSIFETKNSFQTQEQLTPKEIKASNIGLGIAGILGTLAVGLLLVQNYDDHDRSNRYHSIDSAKNLLESCAPNAIIFTGGDNDTFPLWYVQEVEGFRTDVRVCNLSLLGTDWYIDQMKRKTYKSEALPISLTQERYLPNRNESILYPNAFRLRTNLSSSTIDAMSKEGMDLKKYLELVNKNDKRVQAVIEGSDESITIFPSKKIFYRFDREKAIQYSNIDPERAKESIKSFGTKIVKDKDGKEVKVTDSTQIVEESLIKDYIIWDLKANEFNKAELIVLDIIAQNEWKRPIYFSSTLGSSSYMGLKEHLQLEGLAYRLMPYKVKGANDGFINTKIMTENMMKKFHWRQLDNPKAYYYETYFQMTAGLRNAFAKLGLALLDEGKKEEAKKVALFCLEKIPDKAIPYDYYTPRLAGVLLEAGEDKKALEIINTMVKRADEDLEFYLENRPSQLQIIQTQIQTLSFCLNVLQEAGKKDDFLRIRKIFDKHYSRIKQ